MKIIGTAVAVIIILIVVVIIFIYSGIYNIAATEPHSGIERRILITTMEQSVRSHAEGIDVPPLEEESIIQTGVHHYEEMCVICHGAPGVEPSEIGKGLSPEPPDLAEEIEEGEWNSAELFWITKHGIKMTGMPAFGPTHSDEELWGIVAFLKRLPEISPAEYQKMVKASEGRQHEHAHGQEHSHENQEEQKQDKGHSHDHGNDEHGHDY